VAQAVNYILQGVLTFPGATGAGLSLANYQAAGKTGTSNIASGNGTPFAAFAGYTTALVGYVSVFNPKSPVKYPMTGLSASYRDESGNLNQPYEMFGAMAPGQTWHMTFDHANLSGSVDFPPVPPTSALWNAGNGQVVKMPKKPKKHGHGNGNGNGTGTGTGTGTGNGPGTGGPPTRKP
jgi:membrane peptidoglycan carboxypeptidase